MKNNKAILKKTYDMGHSNVYDDKQRLQARNELEDHKLDDRLKKLKKEHARNIVKIDEIILEDKQKLSNAGLSGRWRLRRKSEGQQKVSSLHAGLLGNRKARSLESSLPTNQSTSPHRSKALGREKSGWKFGKPSAIETCMKKRETVSAKVPKKVDGTVVRPQLVRRMNFNVDLKECQNLGEGSQDFVDLPMIIISDICGSEYGDDDGCKNYSPINGFQEGTGGCEGVRRSSMPKDVNDSLATQGNVHEVDESQTCVSGRSEMQSCKKGGLHRDIRGCDCVSKNETQRKELRKRSFSRVPDAAVWNSKGIFQQANVPAERLRSRNNRISHSDRLASKSKKSEGSDRDISEPEVCERLKSIQRKAERTGETCPRKATSLTESMQIGKNKTNDANEPKAILPRFGSLKGRALTRAVPVLDVRTKPKRGCNLNQDFTMRKNTYCKGLIDTSELLVQKSRKFDRGKSSINPSPSSSSQENDRKVICQQSEGKDIAVTIKRDCRGFNRGRSAGRRSTILKN
eukprot:gene6226-11637_t